MATNFIAVILLIATVPAGWYAELSVPSIKTIYTMDGCGPCRRVEDRLKADGHKLCVTLKYSDKSPKESYPTVIYSDGYSDNGQRVILGQYTAKPLIPVVEWKGEKR